MDFLDIPTDASVIDLLYVTIVFIAVFGYVPQIFKLWKSKSDSMDISIATWLIWLYTWVVTLLYGMFELHDLKLCLVAIINLIGHVAIISLTLRNRNRFKKDKQITE
ncbi:MAG: hypothetical protein GW778_01990 [Alphaproteobacteria bacterium]|nr:hypothetical protein [Alphaproteobacteria bacterium]